MASINNTKKKELANIPFQIQPPPVYNQQMQYGSGNGSNLYSSMNRVNSAKGFGSTSPINQPENI